MWAAADLSLQFKEEMEHGNWRKSNVAHVEAYGGGTVKPVGGGDAAAKVRAAMVAAGVGVVSVDRDPFYGGS